MDREYAEYLLKKTKEDYNLIADDFSRTRAQAWEELKFLKDYLISGEKILDLGCGNGRLYELLDEKNIDYYGIDISDKLINIAKNKYPEGKFQVGDVLNISFPDDFFDKVISVAVLHHIPSDEFRTQFLKEAKRVLKRNGLLIITVWNFLTAWNLWRRKANWHSFFRNAFLKLFGKGDLDFKDIFHPWKDQTGKILIQRYIHIFTKRELKRMAKRAGFRIKEIGILERPKKRENNIYLIAEK